MRINALAQLGSLISDAPHLWRTARSIAFGHLFPVYPPLGFEVPQNSAQHPAFQVTAEEVMDLCAGYPLIARVFESFDDLVGHHVAGPVPKYQVSGLLSVLPDS